MTGVPHPQGAEFGKVYPTPEEALAADDGPAFVLPMGLFMEDLRNPHTQAFLSHLDEIAPDDAITLEEYEERFGSSEHPTA